MNNWAKKRLIFGNVSRKKANYRKYAVFLGISRMILNWRASFHAKKSMLY